MPSDVTAPGSSNLRDTRGFSVAVRCLVLNLTAVESLSFGAMMHNLDPEKVVKEINELEGK